MEVVAPRTVYGKAETHDGSVRKEVERSERVTTRRDGFFIGRRRA
jgi:hypothetical protein